MLFALVGAAWFSQTVSAGVIHVNEGLGSGLNDGSSWANAFRGRLGLQSALAAASPGDQIWVAAGKYAPTSAGGSRSISFVLKNGVEVLGGFAGTESSESQRDPFVHFTTLSGDLNSNDVSTETNRCDNSAHVVRSIGNDATAVLDGFVIEGGYAFDCTSTNLVDREEGGGMLIEGGGPTVRRCFFMFNTAGDAGGGLCIDHGAPIVDACEFDRNKCYRFGAGAASMKNSSPTFEGCTFIENIGSQGSGLHAGLKFGEVGPPGSVVVRHSSFLSNSGQIGAANGGGVNISGADGLFEDCLFDRNDANGGGGIFVSDDASIDVRRSVFAGNLGNGDLGDAVYVLSGSARLADSTVTGHLRRANQGDASAFLVRGTMDVDHCTIARNGGTDTGADWGTAVFVLQDGTLKVRNSIIWGNVSFQGSGQEAVVASFGGGGSARFDHSCVQGWNGALAGNASFSSDPQLQDPDGFDNIIGTADDNVRLLSSSPCIDRANNTIAPSHSVRDLDGNDRFVNITAAPDTGVSGGNGGCAISDVGAYERQADHPCPADIDCSGFVDTEDFDAFVRLFEAGNPAADFDLSAFVDTDDFDRFVEAFETGC